MLNQPGSGRCAHNRVIRLLSDPVQADRLGYR